MDQKLVFQTRFIESFEEEYEPIKNISATTVIVTSKRDGQIYAAKRNKEGSDDKSAQIQLQVL